MFEEENIVKKIDFDSYFTAFSKEVTHLASGTFTSETSSTIPITPDQAAVVKAKGILKSCLRFNLSKVMHITYL